MAATLARPMAQVLDGRRKNLASMHDIQAGVDFEHAARFLFHSELFRCQDKDRSTIFD